MKLVYATCATERARARQAARLVEAPHPYRTPVVGVCEARANDAYESWMAEALSTKHA